MLKAAEFTTAGPKTARFALEELREPAGFKVAELKADGFTPTEPKVADFVHARPEAARFTLAELLEPAGFKLAELKAAGFKP